MSKAEQAKALKKRGYTRKEIALKMGISTSRVGQLLTGYKSPHNHSTQYKYVTMTKGGKKPPLPTFTTEIEIPKDIDARIDLLSHSRAKFDNPYKEVNRFKE